MARTQVTVYTDDLDGTEIQEGKGGPVRFGFVGTEYEIDLTDKNREKLVKALEPFINKAQKVTRTTRGKSRGSSSAGPSAKELRDWGRQNGWPDLSDRGRVPAEVREAYESRK